MPLTDYTCPECGGIVHTDGLIDGEHVLGCGVEFSEDWLEERGW